MNIFLKAFLQVDGIEIFRVVSLLCVHITYGFYNGFFLIVFLLVVYF